MTVPLLAGVVGWPIGHSLSPRLHGHWLRRHRIPGYYVPIGLPPDRFEPGLRSLSILGFRGVNVTIPHKETALRASNRISARAKTIGAANTLTFAEDGTIDADNTDGEGFLASVRAACPGWSARQGPALVLGAGGAARAVVWALLDAGAPEVRLSNRSSDRAENLAEAFQERIDVVAWEQASASVDGASLIVNTTSLGMDGQPKLPLTLDAAATGAVVVDLVYAPLETALLAEATARNLVAVDGLGMLLHQAVTGFERWYGVRPEVDDDLRRAVLAG